MAKNLFDHIKGVTKDKVKAESLTEEDWKSWSNFMVGRWFSMEPELTEAMNDFQQYYNGVLSSEDFYKLLFHSLPKSSFYLKYIKRKTKIELEPQFVEILCRHFELGKAVIFEYIKDLKKLNENELVSIIESYGTPKEDVAKFKKQLSQIT